jgi:hypothetical protein
MKETQKIVEQIADKILERENPDHTIKLALENIFKGFQTMLRLGFAPPEIIEIIKDSL